MTQGIGNLKIAKKISQSKLDKLCNNFKESGFDLIPKPDDKLVVQVQVGLISYKIFKPQKPLLANFYQHLAHAPSFVEQHPP